MSDTERRKHPRHKIEIGVTILKKDEKVPAAMINISSGGVGLISDREIFPGENVHIKLNYIGDAAIQGVAKWEKVTSSEGRTIYRIGIESDETLAPGNLWKEVLPETEKNE